MAFGVVLHDGVVLNHDRGLRRRGNASDGQCLTKIEFTMLNRMNRKLTDIVPSIEGSPTFSRDARPHRTRYMMNLGTLSAWKVCTP